MDKEEFLAAQRELEKEKEGQRLNCLWLFLGVCFGLPLAGFLLILILGAILSALS